MAVCPICGCKTDDLDFVKKQINDIDCKVCSFCSRQLNVFETEAEPTEAQLRWIDAVILKDVPERSDEISKAIKEIRSRFSQTEPKAYSSAEQKATAVQQVGVVKKPSVNYESDDVIKDLQNRISVLESEIRTMKRKQMIKTIVELGAPFVLFVMLLIIVLNSGLIDNMKMIFDMAGVAF